MLVERFPQQGCLEFKSPPTMNRCPREEEKATTYFSVILGPGGQYIDDIANGVLFSRFISSEVACKYVSKYEVSG